MLLLDALGTLVRLEDPVGPLREVMSRRFAIGLSEVQAASALAAEIAFYRAHLNAGRDQESLATLRRRSAEVLRAALPPSPALSRVAPEELTEALLASLRFSAHGDAPPALRAARGRGVKTVVVSNWDVSLHEVLAGVALAPLLDGIVTSAEVGARKPAARVFQHALALAGAAPEEALHVGDSPREDVEGALAAGIEPVLLVRPGRPRPAGVGGVRVIGSLLELGWDHRGSLTSSGDDQRSPASGA
ncbi:MAG: HAD family hydrolase [Actinomycetota bacterium]|nr:HAD family hydrolase [Actinomycetota bacterium]